MFVVLCRSYCRSLLFIAVRIAVFYRLCPLYCRPLPFVVLLLPTAAFALPLILFVLSIGRRSSRPALRPFRIIRSSFFSLHSVLLFLSISRSFLLLVASASYSHDSLYASSACNYCQYVLSASPSVFLFSLSYTFILFYLLSISFQCLLNLVNIRNIYYIRNMEGYTEEMVLLKDLKF